METEKNMEMQEKLARAMYDVYCTAVGGKAWNGEPLPGSAEFFTDAGKQVQADGWRRAAGEAMQMLSEERSKWEDVAGKAAAAAKVATGWRKWVAVAVAVGAAVAALFVQSCTPVQVRQAEAVHELYHVVTGEPCVFEVGKEGRK